MQFALALALLVAVLGAALARPRGLPEAAVAVPAAGAVVAFGLLSLDEAAGEVQALGPTMAFLAAVLVLGRLCAADGLFTWAGQILARAADDPRALLGWVFVLGTAITSVLSLDATVVLFTPVVLAACAHSRVRARPHLHATIHLANAASLLLPVANLTNLLAFEASGVSFTRFAALMALPLVVVLVVEYVGVRLYFRADLAAGVRDPEAPKARLGAPRFALVVLGSTLAALAAGDRWDLPPWLVAAAGAAVLAARAAIQGRGSVVGLVRGAEPQFLAFVFALAIVVRAAADHGLAEAAAPWVDHPPTLGGLLLIAAAGAVVANLVNNLPATLLLLPLVAASSTEAGPGPVLALLIGVNIGPNLTYVGSLATMLWLRVAHSHGERPSLADFTWHGLLTVPTAIGGAVLALWLGLTPSGA